MEPSNLERALAQLFHDHDRDRLTLRVWQRVAQELASDPTTRDLPVLALHHILRIVVDATVAALAADLVDPDP